VLKTLAVRRESRAAALQANTDSTNNSSSARRGSMEWQLQQQQLANSDENQVSEISIKSEPLVPGTGGARRVTAAAAAAAVPAAAAVYDATDEGRKAAQGNKTAATAFDGTVLAAAQGV
jgi:hypothetical protein